jgi:hypothetical protein
LNSIARKEREMENGMEIVKVGRYFALYDHGELVCITVYKKGAQEVKRRIEEVKRMVELAEMPSQPVEAYLRRTS